MWPLLIFFEVLWPKKVNLRSSVVAKMCMDPQMKARENGFLLSNVDQPELSWTLPEYDSPQFFAQVLFFQLELDKECKAILQWAMNNDHAKRGKLHKPKLKFLTIWKVKICIDLLFYSRRDTAMYVLMMPVFGSVHQCNHHVVKTRHSLLHQRQQVPDWRLSWVTATSPQKGNVDRYESQMSNKTVKKETSLLKEM